MATLMSTLDPTQLTLTPTTTSLGRKMIAITLDKKPLLLQLNRDETDLFPCPFGLDRESDLYPDPQNRTIRFVPTSTSVFDNLDKYFRTEYEMNHASWGLPPNLEYVPLVKTNGDIGEMVRAKISLSTTALKKFHKSMTGVLPADYTCITPGSECLFLVRASGLWTNETKYGLTLNVRLMLVKTAEKKNPFEDLILQSHLASMEED